MRHVLGVLAIAVVASLVFAPVVSAQGKVVRGKVVTVGADTVTVDVAGKDMTFKVDKETDLIARGAGTAQRKAEQEGTSGVMLGKFVKAGEGVEVHYKEAAGVMMATEIRAGISVPAAAGEAVAAPSSSARGTVSAVGNDSLSVKGEKEWTFKVDPKTTVIGSGVGTLSRKLKEQGKAATITDLVGVGDSVRVSFKEVAGAMQATEVRILTKAAK